MKVVYLKTRIKQHSHSKQSFSSSRVDILKTSPSYIKNMKTQKHPGTENMQCNEAVLKDDIHFTRHELKQVY